MVFIIHLILNSCSRIYIDANSKRVFAALSLEIEVYVAIFDEGYATADELVSHKAVVGCDIR